MTGRQIATEIMANVDRWQAREISFEEFGTNQRRLWDLVIGHPRQHENVLAYLRQATNNFGMGGAA